MNRNRKTKRIFICVLVVAVVFLVTGRNVNADFVFGTAKNLGPTVNSAFLEGIFCISYDGLELYFPSDRPGGHGSYDLWVTKRTTLESEWGTPVNLGSVINSAYGDGPPSISPDGLELFFSSNRPGGSGGWDLWMSTRVSMSESWQKPLNLGPIVNTPADEMFPCISSDGLSLYFSDWFSLRSAARPDGYGQGDLWVTARATTSELWSIPVNLGPTINTSLGEACPWITTDGSSLLFTSNWDGGYGQEDIWMTKWNSGRSSWDDPVNLGPIVNSPSWEAGGCLSPNGSTFYFISTRLEGLGDYDIWQVSIEPVVDLNSDGIVDSADMCIMVDHWGEDYSLCDIGPAPFGDGIVGVQDLIILAEHLFEETTPVE